MYASGLTELRAMAFIPVVLGIFWGVPAAIGIFLGHMICNAICAQTGVPFLLAVLIDPLSAIGARYLFYLPVGNGMVKGQYIHDFWSLLKFVIVVFITESVLSAVCSTILCLTSESSFGPLFKNILLNNIHSIYILGIPVMLFLPLFHKWADEPVSTIGKEEALYGYSSANSVTFRKVIVLSTIFATAVCAILMFMYKSGHGVVATSIEDVLSCFTFIDVLFLLFSAFIICLIQRELVVPLRTLASKLTVDGESYLNEFDIISKSMDFVVSGSAELLSGAEYSVIVGLTTKDQSKKYSIPEAREIINEICLRHVKGYISSVDGEGGYRGESSNGGEQMLIYTIYGASDSQIYEISDDILASLNQESVLIEKDKRFRFYYYGNKR